MVTFVLVYYLFSPYRLSISVSTPPIASLLNLGGSSSSSSSSLFSSSPNFDAVDRDPSPQIPHFEPVDFVPQNGNEEKSFDLYKKARVIDPDDVIINKIKVPWHEFDMKGSVCYSL